MRFVYQLNIWTLNALNLTDKEKCMWTRVNEGTMSIRHVERGRGWQRARMIGKWNKKGRQRGKIDKMRERDSGFVRLRESLRLCIQLNCRAEKAVNLNPFLVRFIAAQSKSAFLHRSPSEILFCFNKNANFMYFCECFCCCWFLFHFSCRFYWFFSYFSWWLHFKMYVDEFDWICCCKIQMYTQRWGAASSE